MSVGFEWGGVGSTKLTMTQTAYQAFHRFAQGVFGGEVNSKFVMMPFPSARFTRRQLWVNLVEFENLVPDWDRLKIYIYPNSGNPYILNKADKTGAIVYKTRMRFGLQDEPSIIMQELRTLLSADQGAGVFKTPIQRSQIARIGFLPLYPSELVTDPICKDLMRLCEFRYC